MVGKRSKKDSGKILTPEACNNVPLLENVSCLSATMELSEDYTASLSHGGTHIGIPDSLVKVFLSRSIQKRDTYTEYEARQFSSGCQDNFAIFAFLAFLLTVLDLVLEMQARRKKRSEDNLMARSSILSNEVERNATLVTYSLFRGFMNSVDAMPKCKMKYICEGAQESLKYGYIAPKMINLTRYSYKNITKIDL